MAPPLWFVVVGALTEPLPVSIDPSYYVGSLVTAIMKMRPQMFDRIGLSQVDLYLAKDKDGKWLRADGPDVQGLMRGDEEATNRICARTSGALRFRDTIGQHFTGIGEEQTHVIVRKLPRLLPIIRPRREVREHPQQSFWCLIVGFGRSSVFSVSASATSAVAELQASILACQPDTLAKLGASNLHVYPAQNRQGGWLAKDHPDAAALCKADSTAVAVWLLDEMHPLSRIEDRVNSVESETIQFLVRLTEVFDVVEDNNDEEHRRNTKPLREVADALKNGPEVVRLMNKILEVRSRRSAFTNRIPFIVLANSSGTGKTQMAFNLMAREEVEVFYIVCKEDVREDLHKGFSRRSIAFMQCVKQDVAALVDITIPYIMVASELYTFGYIWALLNGAAVFNAPMSRDKVLHELENWAGSGKFPICFLDEFADNGATSFQFMRNVFSSLGIVVILSASIATVSDLVSTRESHTPDCPVPWCVVWPTLPPFQYLSRRPLGSISQEIIEHSRPSLAKLAVKYAHANPFTDGMDFVKYMDAMVESLSKDCIPAKRFQSKHFRVGQVCFCFAASSEAHRLKSEEDTDVTSCLISEHFARPCEPDPFELWMPAIRNVVKTDSMESFFALSVVGETGKTPWVCRAGFSTPEHDALLHLVLMGSKRFDALRDLNSIPFSFRCAFIDAERTTNYALRHFYRNVEQPSNDGMRLEAFVTGANVIASRRNGFAGTPFSDFFSALLYELGMQDSPDLRLLFPNDVLGLVSSITVPFLGQPNVEWPAFLSQTTLNLGKLNRARNGDQTDILLLDGEVAFECKDYDRPLPVDQVEKILVGHHGVELL